MSTKSATAPARYTLHVTITKTNEVTGAVEHTASVMSHNLELTETIDMQLPLLDVLAGWVKADAE